MASAAQGPTAEEHQGRQISTCGWDGKLDRIHHALYVAVREQAGREASPTTAIIDGQSGKGAQKRGPCSTPQGFDAGKKITGCKRQILVDTLGLLLSVAFIPSTFRIATVSVSTDRRRGVCIRSSSASTAIPAIKGRRSRRRSPRPVTGQSRSSNARLPPSDSKSYPSAGSSNAPLPGSAVSAA